MCGLGRGDCDYDGGGDGGYGRRGNGREATLP